MLKKNLALLTLLFGFGFSSQSQVLIALVFGDKLNSPNVEFGLELGPNISYLDGYDPGNWASSFFIGPSFNIRLNEHWWIHPSVQVVSSIGVQNLDPYPTGDPEFNDILDQFRIERRINFISVPLMARYAITPHWMLQAGFEPALMTSATDMFTADIEAGATLDIDITDSYSRIDARLVGGLAYRFRTNTAGLWISAKYCYGLLDYPDPNSDLESRMQYWQITFEIPIGAAATEE